jgi:hypothetical protein
MLDSALAALYGVSTKALNQAVTRNLERFPSDFMLQLTVEEARRLRSQLVTLDVEPPESIRKEAPSSSQHVTSSRGRGRRETRSFDRARDTGGSASPLHPFLSDIQCLPCVPLLHGRELSFGHGGKAAG